MPRSHGSPPPALPPMGLLSVRHKGTPVARRQNGAAEPTATYPSNAANTESSMSALVCTACTSSWSSIASGMRRSRLAYPSPGSDRSVGGSRAASTGSGVGRGAGDDPVLSVVGEVLGTSLHAPLNDLLLVEGQRRGHDPLALE